MQTCTDNVAVMTDREGDTALADALACIPSNPSLPPNPSPRIWEDPTLQKSDQHMLFHAMHECVHARRRALVDLLLRHKRGLIDIENALTKVLAHAQRSKLPREADRLVRHASFLASKLAESLPSDTVGEGWGGGTLPPDAGDPGLARMEVMLLLARADNERIKALRDELADLADARAVSPSAFRKMPPLGGTQNVGHDEAAKAASMD